MRYLIKYTKEADIKFISHLDLLRTIQRTVRRASLPIKYSKGFNPHMDTSIAQPLSVGVYSDGEYMDMILEEELDSSLIIEKLNEKTASGVKYIKATPVPFIENQKKTPQAMALIDAARYIIKIKYNNLDNFNKEMENLLNSEKWIMLKRSKKSEREVDIRPMVKEIKYWSKDEYGIFNILISTGSREHLSADLFIDLIKKSTTNFNEDEFIDIKREEMYFLKNDTLVPLYECV